MRQNVSRDIWEDIPVLLYLTSKRYDGRANESEKSRIRKRARRHIFQNGQLFRQAQNRLREVPVIADRLQLAAFEHCRSGHRGEKAVLKLLRQRFFWERMDRDVKLVTEQCEFCMRRGRSSERISHCLSKDHGSSISNSEKPDTMTFTQIFIQHP